MSNCAHFGVEFTEKPTKNTFYQAKKTNRQINGNNTERSKAAVYKQKQRSDLKLNRESTNNCIVTEKDKKLMVNIML
jgi:hypothetical protein